MAIVKQAVAAGHRVRAVGGTQPPFAPVVPRRSTTAEPPFAPVLPRRSTTAEPPGGTDGILVDLSGYGRMLRVDRQRGRATVQAGRTLSALHLGLAARGLSLANGPDDPTQSIGSAVSVGAHGTGGRFPGLAAEVVGLEIVTATGQLVACSALEAPDIFAAARVGLGALGVISSVTVRCEPAFNLRSETTWARLNDLLAHFDEQADGTDHFEFSWLAGTSWARSFRANRTGEPRGAGRGYRVFPSHGPRRPFVEYSLPRPSLVAAIGQLRARIADRAWATPFPIRVRVTAGDDIPLSTATGRPSAYIAVPPGPLAQLLDALGGRPDWIVAHGAALRHRYPRWDEWQAVRHRLDPDRRFANAFTERVLGP